MLKSMTYSYSDSEQESEAPSDKGSVIEKQPTASRRPAQYSIVARNPFMQKQDDDKISSGWQALRLQGIISCL